MCAMYGTPVALSNLRMEGARPDGSVDVGSDLYFIVDFDKDAAGCEADGYCDIGAAISWFFDGQYAGDTIGGGYNERFGYAVTSPVFVPNTSGVHTVTVKSGSYQLSKQFTAVSASQAPGAGVVRVTNIGCGNGPDYDCSCESNGQLIIYFERTVVSRGNGVAYVDVYVDNSLVLSDAPTSSGESLTMDSVTISCPRDGRDHMISVRGRNDIGSAVMLSASSPLGGRFAGSNGSVGGLISSGGLIPIGLGIPGSPVGTTIDFFSSSGSLLGGNQKAATSVVKKDDTLAWVAGGVVAVIGGIIFAKYLDCDSQ